MITEQMKSDARHWVVRLSDETSPQARAQLDDWLAQNPSHADAYDNAQRVWSAVGSMKHLASLVDPAMSFPARSVRESRNRARARIYAIAASVLVAIGVAFVLLSSKTSGHQTAIAEIRDVTLPDGSTATLGGLSAFYTQYTDAERRVVLKSGEAIFSVATDTDRPFIVLAGDISVRALGTQFEVHRGAGRIRVSVLEGVVEVAKPNEAMRLAAGQQITVTVNEKLKEASLKSVSQPVTWRSGTLRYEDASLAEILADANRYSPVPIELGDPGLGELRLTTSFGARQVDQLLDSLPGVLPVRLDRADPTRVVVYPREPVT